MADVIVLTEDGLKQVPVGDVQRVAVEVSAKSLKCTVGQVRIEANGPLRSDDIIEIEGEDVGGWIQDVHIHLSVSDAPRIRLEGAALPGKNRTVKREETDDT